MSANDTDLCSCSCSFYNERVTLYNLCFFYTFKYITIIHALFGFSYDTPPAPSTTCRTCLPGPFVFIAPYLVISICISFFIVSLLLLFTNYYYY